MTTEAKIPATVEEVQDDILGFFDEKIDGFINDLSGFNGRIEYEDEDSTINNLTPFTVKEILGSLDQIEVYEDLLKSCKWSLGSAAVDQIIADLLKIKVEFSDLVEGSKHCPW